LLAAVWYRRGIESSVEPVQVNGGPGPLVRVSGQIDGVLAVRVENGYIAGPYHVRNPEKFRVWSGRPP
jgi:RNA polymerase sigma-70 factor (ECF subfamily)